MENNGSTYFFLVHFPASSQEHPAGSDIFASCSDIQGEGHTAQVSVSRGVVDDALSIQLALYLDVSVVLHRHEAHSHHRRRVVCVSELPIVWIVIQVKKAFREKFDFSQGVCRSSLNSTSHVDWFALAR